MIKSMTGYGKASLFKETRQYQVELKSVNHRYLDISVKMPRAISYLEEDVKKEISRYIKRGKIDIFITYEDKNIENKQIKINKEIAKIYIKELRELAETEKLQANIEVTEITKFPDVLKMENPQEDEIIKDELIECACLAAKELLKMREKEGQKIAEDLIRKN